MIKDFCVEKIYSGRRFQINVDLISQFMFLDCPSLLCSGIPKIFYKVLLSYVTIFI